MNKRTPEERKAIQSKGGKASGEARRHRKEIATALREVLNDTDEEGITIQDRIVVKCLKSLANKGDMKDLKTLTEILGENVIKMEVNTPQIVVEEKDASMVADLMGQQEVE